MITELNPDAFWSRFHVCLERAMKNGGFRTKKDFFTHHGIPYSSYDNAVRLGRIPATDIICRYAKINVIICILEMLIYVYSTT